MNMIQEAIIKKLRIPNVWIKKPQNVQEVRMLPTIDTIKEILKNYERKNPVTRPDFPFIKTDDENKFIVTRTQHFYSFKPNITNKWFIYRGESTFHEPCTANLRRGLKRPNFLANNLRMYEFWILLDSHPLIQLLGNGIPLDSKLKLQIYNPYGLAQHYYLKTSLLDLTSDIDVAIFFAVTDYDASKDTYSIHEPKSDDYGVLYVYYLRVPFCWLSLKGLTTIGLQPFLRPARQKGFTQLMQEGEDFNSNPFIIKLFFRHNKDIAKKFFDKMNQGEYLFPNDELEEMAKDIRNTNILSLQAFNRNLKDNSNDNPVENMYKLYLAGIEIRSDVKPHIFTKDNLDTYYKRIDDGAWQDFCNSLVFPNNNEFYKEKLIAIKDDDKYAKYFRR